MEKKRFNKITELCLDAEQCDLDKENLKTPLIIVDGKTKKCKFEYLTDKNEEGKEDKKGNKNH
jgi:hypothetical protein